MRRQHFFHGTSDSHGLEVGGKILPPAASKVASANVPKGMFAGARPAEYDQRENASVSESSHTAWAFAHMTAGNTGGRAVVHVTGRAEDMRLGVEHRRNPDFRGGWPTQEHISRTGFPITGREDIQPPEKWERKTGRQGTLPIDWHPTTSQGPIWSDAQSANHPSAVQTRAEARAVAKQDKVRATDELVATNVGRSNQRGRQQMLPGMRGMKR